MEIRMEIIRRRDIIRSVRDRWTTQYGQNDEKRKALAALDLETCSAADVVAVLGTSWVENECDECQKDLPVLMRFGEEPEYDARWQDLCVDCLKKAVVEIELTQMSDTEGSKSRKYIGG
jgi:hypothetical protein